MKKLTLFLGALMIAGASFACDGNKKDGKACCKKGDKKEAKACCSKDEKKNCKHANAAKKEDKKDEKKS